MKKIIFFHACQKILAINLLQEARQLWYMTLEIFTACCCIWNEISMTVSQRFWKKKNTAGAESPIAEEQAKNIFKSLLGMYAKFASGTMLMG